MADYAKPTTAAEALRVHAAEIKHVVRLREQELAERKAAVEALREQASRLEDAAELYDRFQPKPKP
jgi:hypothetical protein